MLDLDRIIRDLHVPSPAPLHGRLRDALTMQITDGTIKAGEALPSERVLREKLEVSRATVRQALHGLIEAGLVQSVPGSGNYVLEHQGPLIPPLPLNNDNKVIGLIVSQPSFHIYYGQLAAVFNQRLRKAGWHTDLALHNERLDTLQENITSMLLNNIRVFSINPPPHVDITPILDDLLSHGALVQLLGRWIDYPHCDYVGTDNESIGYQAAQHLIQLGHTQIIYQGPSAHPTGRDRANGYLRAMQEAGLAPRIFNVQHAFENQHAPGISPYLDPVNTTEALFNDILQQKITAAFCFNDDGAAWMYNQLRKINLTVPRDLSIVSVDNMPFYGYVDAPLTTFALSGEEVGLQAAELMLRRISGETFAPQRIHIPAHFVKRLSTAPPRG